MTEPTSGNNAGSAQGYDITGMVVALCSPTYGNVDPTCSKTLRAAVMFAANQGVLWAGDSSPDKMGYGAARNTGVQHILNYSEEIEGIVWVDSDINMPINSIAKLLGTAKRSKIEFLSGVYHQRHAYHNPVFYRWNPDMKCFQPAQDYPPNTIGIADGCGFGFVYTSMKLIRDISISSDFDPSAGWFPDRRHIGGFGEDLSFCELAKKAGHQLYVDSGIQVLHQGDPHWVGEEDFRQKQREWLESGLEPKRTSWGI